MGQRQILKIFHILLLQVFKLDIDKLVPVPVNLSNLSDVVKNDVVNKTVYDKLVAKVNNIDTSRFALKTKYDTDKSELENKIPDTSNLVKKADNNNKITEIKGKILNVSSFVKKTDYNTKITEIENKLNNHNHDKYFDTQEFNTLAADVFNARLAQATLITKTNFDGKLWSLNRKITANKPEGLLVETELKNLKTFDSSYFIGKSHFEEDGTQNYLVFQPINKYFKVITNTDYVSSWKSKGLSAETIKPPTTSDNNLTPAVSYYGIKERVKFAGSCLKEPKISYTHGKVVKIYIVYELGSSSSHNNDPTLENCLFGAVTFTKNADIDKYGYTGYGIGFDRKSVFSFPGTGFGQNILIFGADISSSAHIDNKKKDIVLGKRPTQGLEHTLTAEKM